MADKNKPKFRGSLDSFKDQVLNEEGSRTTAVKELAREYAEASRGMGATPTAKEIERAKKSLSAGGPDYAPGRSGGGAAPVDEPDIYKGFADDSYNPAKDIPGTKSGGMNLEGLGADPRAKGDIDLEKVLNDYTPPPKEEFGPHVFEDPRPVQGPQEQFGPHKFKADLPTPHGGGKWGKVAAGLAGAGIMGIAAAAEDKGAPDDDLARAFPRKSKTPDYPFAVDENDPRRQGEHKTSYTAEDASRKGLVGSFRAEAARQAGSGKAIPIDKAKVTDYITREEPAKPAEPTAETPPTDTPKGPATPPANKTGGGGGKPAKPELAGGGDAAAADRKNRFDSFLNDWGRKAEATLAKYNTPPEVEDEFEEELRNIRQEFTNSKDALAWREVGHSLAEALTKVGAGLYGQATGQDIGHLRFKDHDFSKDMALLQDELKTNLGDLAGRRQEDMKKREKAADLSMNQLRLKLDTAKAADESDYRQDKMGQDAAIAKYQGEVSMHNASLSAQASMANTQLMNALRQDQLRNSEIQDQAERMRKDQESWGKTKQKIAQEFQNSMELAEKKGLDEEGIAGAGMASLTGLGIPEQDLKQAFFDKGLLWGWNAKGPADRAAAANALVEKYVRPPLWAQDPTTKQWQRVVPRDDKQEAFLRKAGWQ